MPLSLEEIGRRAIEGQGQLLAEMLEKGIALTYMDDKGRIVKEHPDGRIEVLKEPERADAAHGQWA